jgi:DNA-binding transcriptional MocR family regulator
MKPDKNSTTPLYIQIRDDLRAAILSGKLAVGEKLPPVTALAEEKDVTAATIRRALQDLTDEGLITSHVGRGTFVADPAMQGETEAGEDTGIAARKRIAGESAIAARKLRQSVTQSLNEMLNLAHRPGVIAFTRGIGDPDTVEKDILTRLAQKTLSGGEEMFRDTGDPRGLLSLRRSIARLYDEQGLDISPDQILVTSGSQQAVALVAQQAAENGSPILCETPCYTGVTNAFSAFGLDVETVGRDADGPEISRIPPQWNAEGSVFYLCPVLHNPSGTDISATRQKEIAAWARDNHVTILSDEIFRDLHPAGSQPPSFLKSPGPDRSIVLGSLSKSFISGLRVGWIVTSEERVRSLTRIKKAMDLGCPPLMQGIAQAFLDDEAGYAAHREKIRAHYGRLRDATLAALEAHMPSRASWSRPQGGFQLWVTLPQGFSSVELFLRCVERGVAFLPGPLQDINNRFMNSFRLCYGSLTDAEITEGIRRLGETIREYLDETPGDSGFAGLGDF